MIENFSYDLKKGDELITKYKDVKIILVEEPYFKENNISAVDYKDVKLLKRFTNDNGKIMPRRVTGTSAKMHRKVVGAIKRARTIGLMPFVDSGSE